MDRILKAVIPKRQSPKVIYISKRAITEKEHQQIIEREKNLERRALYELCWHLGGSQGDVANLNAEDVDWTDRTISYDRQKLKNREPAFNLQKARDVQRELVGTRKTNG